MEGKTIHDLYKASGVRRLHIITLVCVAVELDVGSSGSVSSLMVLLDIAQTSKLDDSDCCSKHVNKW